VKVLVAEDEHSILRFFEVILGRRGFEVIYAHDGIEALEKMHQVSPHVILLDLNMPRMDGFILPMQQE